MAIGFPVAIFVVMRIGLLVNCAFHHLRMRVQVPAA